MRPSLGEQGARRVGKDYKVEPVAVTSGLFPPRVSVFLGREASGRPTAIDAAAADETIDLESLSGGEREQVQVAVRLALAELLTKDAE